MAICPSCHASNLAGARFCDTCGSSLQAAQAGGPANAHPSSSPGMGSPAAAGGSVLRTIALAAAGAAAVLAAGAVVLAALMLTGDPAPCVTRQVDAPPAAVAGLMARWDTFKAAAQKAPAELSFNESEATARGIAYINEKNAPVDGLQVYFCPDGRAQAYGSVSALGLTSNVLVTGTLDLSGTEPRIQVTDAQAGNLPGFLGRRIVDSILDNGDFRTLHLGVRITGVTYSDGSARLQGGP